VVVELHDAKMLVGRILVRVHQLCGAIAEVLAIRNREQQIQIRLGICLNADKGRLTVHGHEALMREGVGKVGTPYEAVALAKLLVGSEVEQLVGQDRTADGATELIALEWREVSGREEVARVERVVTVELEDRSANLIRARLGDRAHDTAGRAPELRAV